MTTEKTELLDETLDDLADLPESKPYSPGVHRVLFNIERKLINKVDSYIAHMKAIETVELVESTDAPVTPGQLCDVLFMKFKKDGEANEIAQGQIKKILAVLKGRFGGDKISEIIANSKDAEVLVVTKTREDAEKNIRLQIVDVIIP